MLADNGYEIAAFDTNVMSRSLVYNPLHYLETDADILSFVKGFLRMTEDQRKSGGDPFWPDMTLFLLCCLITYLRDWCPRRNYTFDGVLQLLDYAEVRESDESYESPLDGLFREIETGMHRQVSCPPETDAEGEGPRARLGARRRGGPLQEAQQHDGPRARPRPPPRRRERCAGASTPWKTTRSTSTSTLQVRRRKDDEARSSISVASKLITTTTPDVRRLMCGKDQMHLELLAEEGAKYALFDTFQDTDPETFKLLHGILIWQADQRFTVKAADEGNGFLSRHVQFFLDEFKTLNLPQEVADLGTTRRCDAAETSACASSSSRSSSSCSSTTTTPPTRCSAAATRSSTSAAPTQRPTRPSPSKIGDETVSDHTTSVSRQGIFQSSVSQSVSLHARKLIDAAETGKLGAQECLVCIKKADPARDTRYDLTKHPRYDQVESRAPNRCRAPVASPSPPSTRSASTSSPGGERGSAERPPPARETRPRRRAQRRCGRAGSCGPRGPRNPGGMPDDPVLELGEARPRPKVPANKEKDS